MRIVVRAIGLYDYEVEEGSNMNKHRGPIYSHGCYEEAIFVSTFHFFCFFTLPKGTGVCIGSVAMSVILLLYSCVSTSIGPTCINARENCAHTDDGANMPCR
jgi:hypothetical protein